MELEASPKKRPAAPREVPRSLGRACVSSAWQLLWASACCWPPSGAAFAEHRPWARLQVAVWGGSVGLGLSSGSSEPSGGHSLFQ